MGTCRFRIPTSADTVQTTPESLIIVGKLGPTSTRDVFGQPGKMCAEAVARVVVLCGTAAGARAAYVAHAAFGWTLRITLGPGGERRTTTQRTNDKYRVFFSFLKVYLPSSQTVSQSVAQLSSPTPLQP